LQDLATPTSFTMRLFTVWWI